MPWVQGRGQQAEHKEQNQPCITTRIRLKKSTCSGMPHGAGVVHDSRRAHFVRCMPPTQVGRLASISGGSDACAILVTACVMYGHMLPVPQPRTGGRAYSSAHCL